MTGTCPESRQDIRLNSSSLFPGKPILGPRNFQYCILIPRRIILLVEPKQRGLVKSSKYIFEKTPQKLPESSIEMWSVFPFCDLVHCFCRFMNQTQHPYLYIFFSALHVKLLRCSPGFMCCFLRAYFTVVSFLYDTTSSSGPTSRPLYSRGILFGHFLGEYAKLENSFCISLMLLLHISVVKHTPGAPSPLPRLDTYANADRRRQSPYK